MTGGPGPGTVLIYGATGYAGRLCARRAVEAGLHPVLAGRDRTALDTVGAELGLPTRAFALGEPVQVRTALSGIVAVLNCAGPFAATAPVLMEACLGAGVHYLDLAGEVPEFLAAGERDVAAVEAGIVLMPGAGFGVVPTDCLAAYLVGLLPEATSLDLAFRTVGGVSRGTVATLLAGLPTTGWRRSEGGLVPARFGERRRTVDFGTGAVTVTNNPWRADLVTAARSTGVATVDTWTALPGPVRGLLRLGPRFPGFFRSRAWRSTAGALLRRLPAGPDEKALAAGSYQVWGSASASNGRRVAALLDGPEAYEFTARAAVLLVRRVAAGGVVPGFQTPSTAFGADIVLEIAGVTRRDLDPGRTDGAAPVHGHRNGRNR